MPGSSMRIVTIVAGAAILITTSITAGIGLVGALVSLSLDAMGLGTSGQALHFGALYGLSLVLWLSAYIVLGIDHHDAKAAYEATHFDRSR